MSKFDQKYSWPRGLALVFFTQALLWGGCGRMRLAEQSLPVAQTADTVQVGGGALHSPAVSAEPVMSAAPDPVTAAVDSLMHDQLVVVADSVIPSVDAPPLDVPPPTDIPPVDTLILPVEAPVVAVDTVAIPPETFAIPLDSLTAAPVDSLPADSVAIRPDSVAADSIAAPARPRYDSLGNRYYGEPFIDDVITATNTDSLVYDARTGRFVFYKDVQILMEEQQAELKNSDFVEIDRNTKMIYAHGERDSLGVYTRPTFVDKGHEYDMDSLTFNLNSDKIKIRGAWTTEGEGFLRAAAIKRMPDNSFNISKGTYTTCDDPHPHYEIRMSRGKTLPGQKTIFQWAYLVIEDVPIPFPAIPFGYFPMNSQRSSGFIMPSFGEENIKGFYLKDIGYQYSPNDYMSMRLLGSFYSLGSWEAQLGTNYRLRYKFSGNLDLRYSNNKFGDRGSADYRDTKTYSVNWSHRQDPKSGIDFSASVNFSSSQESRYSPATIADYASNNASSSISYSKSWAGTPFYLAVSARHNQVNRDSTYSFGLPQMTFKVNRITPFKFRNRRPGPARWYEKISMSYTGTLNNEVTNVKEYDLFKPQMFDKMTTTMSHDVPVNANFTVFDFINLTVSGSYRENWDTRRYDQYWDDEQERVMTDTVRGFHRTYSYGGSVSANTMIYGLFEFGPYSKVKAIRHTLSPNISFNLRPDMSKSMYGFYEWVQSNAAGDYTYYSPYRPAPASGAQASMSFRLEQTLEAKVRTQRDSIGERKIKIIDNFSFGFDYNFLADSLKLSPSIPIQFRSTLFKGFNINISTSLGITAVDPLTGRKLNHYFWQGRHGSGSKNLRIENFSTSFNKSWNFGGGSEGGNSGMTNPNVTNPNFPGMYDPVDPYNDPNMDGAESEARRQEAIAAYRTLLTSQYYDFSVPITFGVNGSISYTNNGVKKTLTPLLSFNASVNLTPKWGITVQSGYDFNRNRLIPTTNFTLARDLHCMQMNFNWIPIGPMKSWNFHISVKANILKDLKYEKSGNRFDELLFDR